PTKASSSAAFSRWIALSYAGKWRTRKRYSGYSSTFGRWRFERTSSRSSGCQPKRAASPDASSPRGAVRLIQVSPPLSSSATRGSTAAACAAVRGRPRLMRGRLGTGTEGVLGSHGSRRSYPWGARKAIGGSVCHDPCVAGDFEVLARPHIDARLEPGESVRGIAAATLQKTFSGGLYAVGVTDRRLVLQPLGRKFDAKGEPV